MNIDPADDCTFWYVNEYYTASGQATDARPVGRPGSRASSSLGARQFLRAGAGHSPRRLPPFLLHPSIEEVEVDAGEASLGDAHHARRQAGAQDALHRGHRVDPCGKPHRVHPRCAVAHLSDERQKGHAPELEDDPGGRLLHRGRSCKLAARPTHNSAEAR